MRVKYVQPLSNEMLFMLAITRDNIPRQTNGAIYLSSTTTTLAKVSFAARVTRRDIRVTLLNKNIEKLGH